MSVVSKSIKKLTRPPCFSEVSASLRSTADLPPLLGVSGGALARSLPPLSGEALAALRGIPGVRRLEIRVPQDQPAPMDRVTNQALAIDVTFLGEACNPFTDLVPAMVSSWADA